MRSISDCTAQLNDYWTIQGRNGRRLEPQVALALLKRSLKWLESDVSKPFEGKTIEDNHFAPHRGCIAPQHEGSEDGN